jgi:hypothetical protein
MVERQFTRTHGRYWSRLSSLLTLPGISVHAIEVVIQTSAYTKCYARLDLHLGKTMLPDSDKRSNAILAVVEKNDPNGIRYGREHEKRQRCKREGL